jgi:hypothetical protein
MIISKGTYREEYATSALKNVFALAKNRQTLTLPLTDFLYSLFENRKAKAVLFSFYREWEGRVFDRASASSAEVIEASGWHLPYSICGAAILRLPKVIDTLQRELGIGVSPANVLGIELNSYAAERCCRCVMGYTRGIRWKKYQRTGKV